MATLIQEHHIFFGVSSLEAGAYITARRKALRLNQSQLSEAIGLPHYNRLTAYENGTSDWRTSRYAANIIDALKITKSECIDHLGIKLLIDYRVTDL